MHQRMSVIVRTLNTHCVKQIERETERERYIYIYIIREREREQSPLWEGSLNGWSPVKQSNWI